MDRFNEVLWEWEGIFRTYEEFITMCHRDREKCEGDSLR